MIQNRIKASVAVCVICGCAFAGGLLSKVVAPDKAALGGLLIALIGSAFGALVLLARALWRVAPQPRGDLTA